MAIGPQLTAAHELVPLALPLQDARVQFAPFVGLLLDKGRVCRSLLVAQRLTVVEVGLRNEYAHGFDLVHLEQYQRHVRVQIALQHERQFINFVYILTSVFILKMFTYSAYC